MPALAETSRPRLRPKAHPSPPRGERYSDRRATSPPGPMNKLPFITAICALPLGLAALPPARVDLEREAASMLPAGCLGYVEVQGFSDLCREGLAHPVMKAALQTPLGDLARQEAKMPLPFALGVLNTWAGRPVLPALAELTSGGLAVGVLDSGSDRPTACVVARGNAGAWDEVMEYAMRRVARDGDLPEERVVKPHRRIRGMDVWLLGDYGAVALSDGLFLGSTDEGALRRMLDLGAATGASGLASRRDFREAGATHRSEDPFLWAWADMDGASSSWPELVAGIRDLPAGPLAEDLFGPEISSMGGAGSGVCELRLGSGRMDLDLLGLGVPAADQLAPLTGSPDRQGPTGLQGGLELIEPELDRPTATELRASVGILFDGRG